MSLPLPKLDDRTFADLVAEARARIPGLCPAWTDHNPADPGITLIELFAWLTEMLFFRADQLTPDHVSTFLKLLNGPEWQPSAEQDDDIRETVTALRQRYRAVTAADFEALAREAPLPEGTPGLKRVCCIPRRDLETPNADDAPGHVSLVVVPERKDPKSAELPVPPPQLLRAVWDYLDPRRLLATRHHVVGPTYVPVSVEARVTPRPDAAAGLDQRIKDKLEDFLDPLHGGPERDGWPFGRDVYISELYELLEGVAGVDWITEITLSSECPDEKPRCVEGKPLYHDREPKDLIGLGLEAHHLPWFQGAPVTVEARDP